MSLQDFQQHRQRATERFSVSMNARRGEENFMASPGQSPDKYSVASKMLSTKNSLFKNRFDSTGELIEEQLHTLKMRGQRGQDMNRKWLADKAKAAGDLIGDPSDKLSSFHARCETRDHENLSKYLLGQTKKEKAIAKLQKEKMKSV